MPYRIIENAGQHCVAKVDDQGKPTRWLHCYDNALAAEPYLRALYAAEEGKTTKAIDKNVGGGVDRDKLAASHFVFPDTRTFPIVTAGDVSDAVSSWGRYKGPHSLAEFQSKLTALAKRLGFASSLPKKWSADKSSLEVAFEVAVKSIYDKGKDAWTGLSHNAWKDREEDIIPLGLIENDIAIQKSMIAKGEMDQYGWGLWVDHNPSKVIGNCLLREVIPGGRSCFEMGELFVPGDSVKASTMSVGYFYDKKGDGEYEWVTVYERSALEETRAINDRTFFHVKRRDLKSDAALNAALRRVVEANNG